MLTLFEALFHDDLLNCLRQSLAWAENAGGTVRIRLRLGTTPELANLPWEYLYDRQRNRFLCLWDRTPVVRYSEVSEPARPLEVSGPLRILVMVSSPSDYPRLDIDEEWAKLEDALDELLQHGRITLERLPDASLATLRRRLRRSEYHVFHFIGHAGFDPTRQEGVLVFTATDGTGQWVSGERLGISLCNATSIRLAVLNACEGARSDAVDAFSGVAQSLVQQGVPAVVAMQYEISDRAAIAFASGFFAAVADGLSIEASMSQARRDIHDFSEMEWATPVLYLRGAGGQLFEVEPGTAGRLPRREKARQVRPAGQTVPGTASQPDLASVETDALGAFYTEDWDKAVELFEYIVTYQPDFHDGGARLAEARQRRELKAHDEHAGAALEAGEWDEAIEHLEAIVAVDPSHQDTARRLEDARQRLEVARLWEEAQRLYEAKQWKAVLRVGERLTTLAPDDDPGGILASAREAVAQAERATTLEKHYANAVRAIAGSRWSEAYRALEGVLEVDATYRDTWKLLDVVLKHLAPEDREFAADQVEEALAELNRSLELVPDDTEALERRGVTLSCVGREEEASRLQPVPGVVTRSLLRPAIARPSSQ